MYNMKHGVGQQCRPDESFTCDLYDLSQHWMQEIEKGRFWLDLFLSNIYFHCHSSYSFWTIEDEKFCLDVQWILFVTRYFVTFVGCNKSLRAILRWNNRFETIIYYVLCYLDNYEIVYYEMYPIVIKLCFKTETHIGKITNK